MLHTSYARRGMVTAPHALAAQAGAAVLREGGNAVEAMIAAAATCAVVYPHMNGLGGDGFWLISEPGRPVVSIDGSGAAGRRAAPETYRAEGLNAVPSVGPLSCATVAGTLSGWQSALELSARWEGRLGLARLLEDAVWHAREGAAVSAAEARSLARRREVLARQPGFAALFLNADGSAPAEGTLRKNPALAQTLESLARDGLDDFYRGGIGRAVAADLAAAGAPVTADDLARHRSIRRRPLSLGLDGCTVYNTPPPTQGLASLMILGLYERLRVPAEQAERFAHIHGLIEATKLAFRVRNTHIADPGAMQVHATTFLSDHLLDRLAAEVAPKRAMPWPLPALSGDTVWMGCVDGQGRAVSFIQSLYHAYGSGVVLPETGLVWHNRGIAFDFDAESPRFLSPGRKPFHTLSPALARFRDGRVMVYGTMGGDGQPQTQAALFTRYALYGQGLQAAVTAPRWALGRSYEGESRDVKVERRMDPGVIAALEHAGHTIGLVEPFDDLMGHAGAIVLRPDGVMEGAADPRSDGCVAGY
ncbi:gamma-glutamyltransferase family protein [Caenispirillum bisanense]|uniref:Gamma-glutamyltransferase 2. Threonine peptidase. MEROPS family T03 n=1 Tax=Caenispirillum bisanense TaxID=414052 RepID=A0A286G9J5_9PROT|nr:gamma-glutamyltransferase [Caenispirillum bisanense]SOD92181.1 gamma-glutamyltransferase 2. Threonine peptidase. MEROPS family T03 [Caenispirillum bisanense]